MKKITALLISVLVVSISQAQVTLDDFNLGTATGTATGTWVGQVTQNATTLTVGGTAKDDNGWMATGLNINATGLNFLAVTAQLESGNAASDFAIQFEDASLAFEILNVSTSSFLVGAMSTVYIATNWDNVDESVLESWSLGGGAGGSADFRMTFDNISLVAAIPEPSTYAAIFGVLALGFVAYRRRVAAV